MTRFLGATPPASGRSNMTPIETVALAGMLTKASPPVSFDVALGTLSGAQFSFLLPQVPQSPDQFAPAVAAIFSSAPLSTAVTPPLVGTDAIVPPTQMAHDKAATLVKQALANYAVLPLRTARVMALRAASFLMFEQIVAVSADKKISWKDAYAAVVGAGFMPDKVWLSLLNPPINMTVLTASGDEVSSFETFFAYETAISKIASGNTNGLAFTYWDKPLVGQVESGFKGDIDSVAAGVPVSSEMVSSEGKVVLYQEKSVHEGVSSASPDADSSIANEISLALSELTAAINKLYGYDPAKDAADKLAAEKAAAAAAEKIASDIKIAAEKAAEDAKIAAKAAADKLTAEAKVAADKAATAIKSAADMAANRAAEVPDKPRASTGNMFVAGLIGLTAFAILYATLNQKKAPETEPLIESEIT